MTQLGEEASNGRNNFAERRCIKLFALFSSLFLFLVACLLGLRALNRIFSFALCANFVSLCFLGGLFFSALCLCFGLLSLLFFDSSKLFGGFFFLLRNEFFSFLNFLFWFFF